VSLAIYEVKRELVPYSGSLGDEELDFLKRFQDERDKTYFITTEALKGAIRSYKERGEVAPVDLVLFLIRKTIEAGDFWFMIS